MDIRRARKLSHMAVFHYIEARTTDIPITR